MTNESEARIQERSVGTASGPIARTAATASSVRTTGPWGVERVSLSQELSVLPRKVGSGRSGAGRDRTPSRAHAASTQPTNPTRRFTMRSPTG